MVRKWGTSIFSNGRGGRRRKRRPWCPQPRRVKRREPCCNSWTRKGGPDFQIGDRVEVIRNNNPARRKYAGRIIAVKKGRLGHLGEEQEKIFLFFCNPFARLITCDQCHCPQDYPRKPRRIPALPSDVCRAGGSGNRPIKRWFANAVATIVQTAVSSAAEPGFDEFSVFGQ